MSELNYDSKVICRSLYTKQICSKAGEEAATLTANMDDATVWEMCPQIYCLDPNPNQCDESPEYKHYLMIASTFISMCEVVSDGPETVSSSGMVKE